MQKKDFFVHQSSIIDEPTTIGHDTKIWHFSHISKGVTIGSQCVLGQNVFVGEDVEIGNQVKIQNNVSVYKGVTLEDYVFCGPSMVFTNDLNPRAKYPKHGKFLKTLVRGGASIGANATIVCGITIGRHAFIGSGSVVTKDVPDFALVYGIPAKHNGWVCECGSKLDFSAKEAICPTCQMKYQLSDNNTITQIT